MKKICYICCIMAFFGLCFCSCSSVPKFRDYYEQYASNEILAVNELLQEGQDPLIISSSQENIYDDVYELRANYYGIMGYTGVNGPDVSEEIVVDTLKNLCKELGSVAAVYYKGYTNTETRVTSLPYNNIINYKDSNGLIQRNRITTFSTESYSEDRYDYIAYLFFKISEENIKNMKTGLEISSIPSEMRKKFKQNTGVIVNVVFNKSPAFYANLIPGDIIVKLNNIDILDVNNYFDFFNNFPSESKVDFTVLREEGKVVIPVKY